MAWTTPRLWTAGELVTASMMNTHVRDNLAYLKGSAGTIAFDSGATFNGATTISTGVLTTSGGISTTAITSADWFRVTGSSMGIYNQTHNQGVGIGASGPYNYTTGFLLVDTNSAQNLVSKQLQDPRWRGVSGWFTNGNDLTNYMFVWGATTYTLPAAAGRDGQIRFIKAWGGACTINSGSTNLAGPGSTGMVSSFSLANGDSLTMVCDGTYWWTI